jgi:hypothetical protein
VANRFTLIRDIFTLKNTMGVYLYNDNDTFLTKKMYILEDVARPVGVKIDKETCISEGDYWLTITFSNRFKRLMPLIYNNDTTLSCISGNKRFDGVRQHIGNTEENTEACQLTGFTRNSSGVYQSTNCFNEYFPFLQNVLSTEPNNRILLQIINKQP